MSAKAFVDSNVFIYLHDTTAEAKREVARSLIGGLWERGEGALSIQVLQEFYVNSTRKLGMPGEEAEAQIRRLLAWTVHAPTANDVLAAVQLQRRHQLSFWDAMILTSAERLGCEVLYSEDLNAGQVVVGVQIQNPFS